MGALFQALLLERHFGNPTTEDQRAEESRRIYWFTDSGIIRVQTISTAVLMGVFIVFTFAFVLGVFALILTLPTPISPIIQALMVVAVIAIPIGLVILTPEIVGNRLRYAPIENLIHRKGTIRVPWEEVERIRSVSGVITVWTPKKRYVMFARKNYAAIEVLVRAKIGDRLETQAQPY